MEIVFVKKGEVTKGLDENEIINIFENSNDLEEIKNAVENSNDRIYASWASVEAVDNANEIIPIESVISNQQVLMERGAPISDEHTNKIVGRTLAYKVLEHPETKTLGVLHLDKIYNHNAADDKVWDEIITGKRTGSSVGGINTSMSFSYNKEKNKQVKTLEGFAQMETASVTKPCNPFATNIAYSVVAKSNTDVKKPFAGYKDFETCVSQNQDKENPEAYCGAIQSQVEKLDVEHCKKSQNEENVINKSSLENNNSGETMTNEDIKKTVSELADVVKGLASEVAKLKKEDMPEDMTEDNKPTDEEKTPKETEDKEKKSVAKEDAASDIDGETSAPAPMSPTEDQNNEKEVFKKEMSDLRKSIKELKDLVVKKSQTPAPATNVNKKENLALDIATGKVKMNYQEVHKTQRKN